jgi:hypothetical protein
MNKFSSRLGALFALALVAGCATDDVSSGASITRFHLGQPIARAQIVVEPVDPRDAGSLEFSQVSASVARELTRLGWTVSQDNARSEQVALVGVTQQSREAGRGSGLSIGIGGGTGSYGRRSGVGVGAGATIPVGGSGASQVVATQLSVRIQRRSDATVAWEGRAMAEARAGTPLATRGGAAGRLAEALFRDFPGESGRTIRVR